MSKLKNLFLTSVMCLFFIEKAMSFASGKFFYLAKIESLSQLILSFKFRMSICQSYAELRTWSEQLLTTAGLFTTYWPRYKPLVLNY